MISEDEDTFHKWIWESQQKHAKTEDIFNYHIPNSLIVETNKACKKYCEIFAKSIISQSQTHNFKWYTNSHIFHTSHKSCNNNGCIFFLPEFVLFALITMLYYHHICTVILDNTNVNSLGGRYPKKPIKSKYMFGSFAQYFYLIKYACLFYKFNLIFFLNFDRN